MKRILALLIAPSIIVSLTACGTSQRKAASKPASEPEATPSAASEAEADALGSVKSGVAYLKDIASVSSVTVEAVR